MHRCNVLIVGGGIIGSSVAFHLAERGVKDVVVIDREDVPGKGSTGAATGGFRAQYSTAVNVKLSLLSLEKLKAFQETTGVDPEYNPAGYLFLAHSGETLHALRDALKVQREAGNTFSREVSPAEIPEINPYANLDGIVGGTFCTIDGYMRPLKIMQGYREAAIRLGVDFRFGEEALDVESSGGKITRVSTGKETYHPNWVVNATGAWARELGKLAGVDIPVRPAKRQVAATHPTDLLPSDMAMTVWLSDGFHLRVRDGRVLLIWTTPDVPQPSFERDVDHDWLHRVYERAVKSIPVLKDTSIDASFSWAGLYEMSPDKTSIVGRAPGSENFILANGSSGHGVMHSPALGQLVAELIIEGKTSIDISPLDPKRFSRGDFQLPKDVL